MVGRTTLVIAHRLSTIRNADTIVVLQNTGISEQVRTRTMRNGGLYRRLIEVQTRLVAAWVARRRRHGEGGTRRVPAPRRMYGSAADPTRTRVK